MIIFLLGFQLSASISFGVQLISSACVPFLSYGVNLSIFWVIHVVVACGRAVCELNLVVLFFLFTSSLMTIFCEFTFKLLSFFFRGVKFTAGRVWASDAALLGGRWVGFLSVNFALT